MEIKSLWKVINEKDKKTCKCEFNNDKPDFQIFRKYFKRKKLLYLNEWFEVFAKKLFLSRIHFLNIYQIFINLH